MEDIAKTHSEQQKDGVDRFVDGVGRFAAGFAHGAAEGWRKSKEDMKNYSPAGYETQPELHETWHPMWSFYWDRYASISEPCDTLHPQWDNYWG